MNLPSQRLIFFTGKGGVGKTTLLFSYASWLQKKNKKVVVVSPYLPKEVERHQYPFPVVLLNAVECFKEYTLLWLKFEILYKVAFQNPMIKLFVETVPAVKDTLFAGKIWHLAQKGESDHVLVDLPSFGHAYQFFNSLFGLKQVFKFGFVEKEVTKVSEYFKTEDVRIDLVTLLEEVPIHETREFYHRFSKNIPVRLGHLWVNKVLPQFSMDTKDLTEDEAKAVNLYQTLLTNQKKNLDDVKNIPLPQKEIRQVHTQNFLALTTELVAQLDT